MTTLAAPADVTLVDQAVWVLLAPVRLLSAAWSLVGYRPKHAACGRYVGRHLAGRGVV